MYTPSMMKRVSLYIPMDLYNRINQSAQANKRSINQELHWEIENYHQEQEKKMLELTVVDLEGENRIDSRIVAKSLGIEIKAFHQTLNKYRTELEELGSLAFEMDVKTSKKGNRGGELPKFIMLNEDQAIFASTLSRNSRQVVEFKLALTKAFSQARKRTTSQSYVNPDFVLRLKLNKGRVPYDHWTVLEQIDKESQHSGLGLVSLINTARPDISVGKKWSNYLKKKGHDTSKFQTVPNVVNPGTMYEQDVKAYPLDMLPSFLRWFHSEYQEHFKNCYLPPRNIRKELD